MWPNLITLLRIVLIPAFAIAWGRGADRLALALFVGCGLSDLLDGLLARLLAQQTYLGQILDPAADKLMGLVSFVLAAWLHKIPVWLAGVVIGRDLLLAVGGALFAFFLPGRFDPVKWQPTRLGKYATFFQVLTITCAVGTSVWPQHATREYLGAMVIMCTLMTLVATLQYVFFSLRAMDWWRRTA